MEQDGSASRADFSAKEDPVADVEFAASLMDEVIGSRGVREPVKSMLERAYSLLSKENNAWTRRRVRAVFNKEAQRIDYREVREMQAVLEARKKHAAYRKETARIAAMPVVRAETQDRDLAP